MQRPVPMQLPRTSTSFAATRCPLHVDDCIASVSGATESGAQCSAGPRPVFRAAPQKAMMHCGIVRPHLE
jgi:hypothetical protein